MMLATNRFSYVRFAIHKNNKIVLFPYCIYINESYVNITQKLDKNCKSDVSANMVGLHRCTICKIIVTLYRCGIQRNKEWQWTCTFRTIMFYLHFKVQ